MGKGGEASETRSRVTVIVVASHKGGVGKTTTVAQVGSGLSVGMVGVGAVVLVDADAQGHLGEYLGVGTADDFAAALLGERSIEACLVPVAGYDRLWVMRGAGRTWEDVERTFVRDQDDDVQPLAERLADMFELLVGLVKEGERVMVLVDTAPSFSEMQTAALVVADYILCPMTPDYGGERGMMSTWAWVKALDDNSKGFGALPQKYDLASSVQRRDLRRLKMMLEERVLPAIPYSEDMIEVIDGGLTIWTSEKVSRSSVGAQYVRVLEELASALDFELHIKTGKAGKKERR